MITRRFLVMYFLLVKLRYLCPMFLSMFLILVLSILLTTSSLV